MRKISGPDTNTIFAMKVLKKVRTVVYCIDT